MSSLLKIKNKKKLEFILFLYLIMLFNLFKSIKFNYIMYTIFVRNEKGKLHLIFIKFYLISQLEFFV